MNNEQHDQYYRHLLTRSRASYLYRKYYLYPNLARFLPGKVLDVGCGIGDFLRYHDDAVGIDVNPLLIEHCTAQGLDARLIDSGEFPVEADSFDGAILDNVLEHLEHPEHTLTNVRRALRDKGGFIVGVPGTKGYAADPDHKIFYDAERLETTLSAAGFTLQRLLHMPLKSSWMDRHLSQYCLYGAFRKD